MKSAIFAFALLAGSQAALADDPRSEAVKATERCYLQSAAQFDDGISDAQTIAVIVARSCRALIIAQAQAFGSGENYQVQQGIVETFLERAPSSATEVVLIARSMKRKAAQPPMPAIP